MGIKKLAIKILPRSMRSKIRCLDILENQLGHGLSRRRRECCDGRGQPIPWYTYPALEYLQQIDWTSKSVFEFGSGNSTKFWSKQASTVVAIEHDKQWHQAVQATIDPNVQLQLADSPQHYVDFIRSQQSKFDLIIVDGQYRAACAEQALEMLKPDGAILLDNSDWHPEASAILRDADMLEVDFAGFGPINDYSWTTSLFFTREFRPTFKSARHPLPGTGGLDDRATVHAPPKAA